MSGSSFIVSLILKMVNQATKPLKGLTADLTKASKVADTTAKVLGKTGKAVNDMGDKATKAGKSVSKTGDTIKKTGDKAKDAAGGVDKAKDSLEKTKKPADDAGDAVDNAGKKFDKTRARAIALAGVLGGKLWGALKASITIGLGLATAGAGALTALALWTHGQSMAAEAMLRSAKIAGITAESYQRLKYVFEKSYLGVDVLDLAVRMLNQHMVQAQAGQKNSKAVFQALGISVKDATGHYKSFDTVFGEVADKFAKRKDGPAKTAAAMMLFGRSGARLIPVLDKGGASIKALGDEAVRLGLILNDQTLTASQKMNLSWQAMTYRAKGLSLILFTALLPSMTKLIDHITDLIDKNKPEILQALTNGIDWLNNHLPQILDNISKFVDFLKTIINIARSVINAVGGIGNVFDIIAGIMVGQFAWGMITATASIWGVNTALYAFPGTWIIAAIAAVAFGAYLIIRHWDAVKKWMIDFWGWLKIHLPFVTDFIQPWIDGAELIISHWAQIKSAISGVLDAIASAWNAMPEPLRKFLTGSIAEAIMPGAGILYALQPTGAPKSGAPQSFAAQGLSSQMGQSFNGHLGLTIQSPVPVRVDHMQSSPGFDMSLSRGLLSGGAN